MKFSGPLVIKEIGYEMWEIAHSFHLRVSGLYPDDIITIPEGFITDLASVPHLARSLVPKIGYWSQAAVIHDILYHNHRTGQDTDWTRKEVDKVFRDAASAKADEYGVPESRRKEKILYLGVRMGGLASWETEEERKERLERMSNFMGDE